MTGMLVFPLLFRKMLPMRVNFGLTMQYSGTTQTTLLTMTADIVVVLNIFYTVIQYEQPNRVQNRVPLRNILIEADTM